MNKMRSALLFQYERIIDTVMIFNSEVSLKLIADIGFKDKENNKRRAYEEFQYKSNKYKNESELITAKRNFNYYLRIDYPSSESKYNNGQIIIPTFSILGLRDKIIEFDKILFDPYIITKDNKLSINPNKIKTIESYPIKNSKIEFSQTLYEGLDKDDLDYGVNIGLNNDYFFTIRSITKWKEFVYLIMTCDLYLWGSQLIAPYINQLIGNSLSDQSSYNSIKRYNIETTYESEDYMLNNESSNIIKSKPLDKKSKIKSFFDD